MNKLGDPVFCVDCDELRAQSLGHASEAQTDQAGPRPEARADRDDANGYDADGDDADDDDDFDGDDIGQSLDAHRAARPPSAVESAEHPRRMATKRDANGDPLCSACLDERQSRRRAEFMLADERRTVVHWPRRTTTTRAATTRTATNGDAQLALDPSLVNANGNRQLDPEELQEDDVIAGLDALPALQAPEPTPRSSRSRKTNGLANGSARNGSRRKSHATDAAEEGAAQEGSSTPQNGHEGPLSKAAFVRSLPPSTPAKEVIARARKLGLAITPAYVYVIRSNAIRADIRAANNAKGAKTGATAGAKVGVMTARGLKAANGKASANGIASNGSGNGSVNGRSADSDADKRRGRDAELKLAAASVALARNDRDAKATRGIEQRFMRLAIELGFFRTQQLIDQLRDHLRYAVSRDRRSGGRRAATASA